MPIPPIPPDVAASMAASTGAHATKAVTHSLTSRIRRAVSNALIRTIFFVMRWIVIPFALLALVKIGLDRLATKHSNIDWLVKLDAFISNTVWQTVHFFSYLVPELFTWNI